MTFAQLNKKLLLLLKQKGDDSSYFRAEMRVNLLTFYSIISAMFYAILNLAIVGEFNNWLGFMIQVNFLGISGICLFMLISQRGKLAKTIFLVSTIICYFVYANTNTVNSGMQFGWFMVVFLIFALNSIKYPKKIFKLLGLLLCLILVSSYYDYELFAISSVQLKGERIHATILLLTNLILVCIFSYFLSINFYKTYKEKDKINQNLQVKTENLKKANKELDDFVYHAAHDIRSPLTSMLGLIELGKNETDINKIKHLLTLQQKTIAQLDSYTQQILTISHIKHEKNNTAIIDFNKLMEELEAQIQFMIKSQNIDIHFEQNYPVVFYSSHTSILAIALNLVSNSIKYRDENKKSCFIDIKFSFSKIFLSGLCIEVLDNGIGISEEELDKVTDIFYFNKVKNKGTGYGLHIVKEAVEGLGGKLNLTSELGSHTLAVIDLPNQK